MEDIAIDVDAHSVGVTSGQLTWREMKSMRNMRKSTVICKIKSSFFHMVKTLILSGQTKKKPCEKINPRGLLKSTQKRGNVRIHAHRPHFNE